jgi:hypothetical protein
VIQGPKLTLIAGADITLSDGERDPIACADLVDSVHGTLVKIVAWDAVFLKGAIYATASPSPIQNSEALDQVC